MSETLKDVKFVVGPDGQPTAALVEIAAWQRREAGTPEELGLISWEQAEAELDAREEPGDATVG